MPSAFKFLPCIMEFGQYCAGLAAAREAPNTREARVKAQIEERRSLPSGRLPKPDYTGPIENVKPGDILSWERMEERIQALHGPEAWHAEHPALGPQRGLAG